MAGAMVTTNIMGTTVAMGLNALRERLAICMVANRDYEGEITAMKRMSTVNISVPAAVAVRDVAPDVVPPSVPAVTPTSVALTLTQWKEAPFAMDDKGLRQVDNNILPSQATEAIKSVANTVEDYLFGFYTKAYGYAGVAGTTPFATDTSAYLEARKRGNKQLMDQEPRFMLLNDDAEANALGLRAFQDASFRGDTDGIINGVMGRKLGAVWALAQRIPTHTAGTGAGYLVNNAAGYAIGIKVVTTDTGTGTLIAGDIIRFTGTGGVTGHEQTYTVVSSVGGGAVTSVTFEPGLVTALVDNELIEKKATHAVNSLIHRTALAFASAPLQDDVQVPGAGLQAVAIDEVSGLALRLEVTRQHKQVQWTYDMLYGGIVVRANAWIRLAG